MEEQWAVKAPGKVFQVSMDDVSLQFLKAGEDHFGEQHGLSMSQIDLKLVSPGSSGVLIIENSFQAKGGPPRHLHYDLDEWFYALEGDFTFMVGQETFLLQPGIRCLRRGRYPSMGAYWH